jgi:hypothetical protein
MRVSLQLAAVVPLLSGAALQAESPGTWRVNGAISGRTFTLDCRLDQGAGQCTDASPGGKSQPLTSLSASGNRMNWSFKTRVAFLSVTLAFAGQVAGDRMSGTMTAAGRSGTFTAARR